MHALSIPTWWIHLASVLEWALAIILAWQYGARVPGWRAIAYGMLPALASALCACTWHFFDNAPALGWLVSLQAVLTLVGNTTLAGGAYLLWRERAKPC
ncbi:MAG: DUF2499 domain-containing protein [Oscillatoriales cyanobacterium SM2_1_8]|nr:DUF2499 domain-containing protein [Oscillatoriales cyanobacterium SM2_1_8]